MMFTIITWGGVAVICLGIGTVIGEVNASQDLALAEAEIEGLITENDALRAEIKGLKGDLRLLGAILTGSEA